MSAIKKFTLTLLFILLLLSLMDDLSKPQFIQENEPLEPIGDIDIGIAHIKVKQGDTVLSITETINDLNELDIEQVIADFEQLNPGTTIDTLIPNSFYYFPLYNDS